MPLQEKPVGSVGEGGGRRATPTRPRHLLCFYPADNSRALALVLHGLNGKPETMEEVIALLGELGVSSLLARLSGHRGDAAEEMTLANWRADFRQAFALAVHEAQRHGGRLYVVGHSMGCLLSTVCLAEIRGQEGLPLCLKGCVYFAPADGVRSLRGVIAARLPAGKELFSRLVCRAMRIEEDEVVPEHVVRTLRNLGVERLPQGGRMLAGRYAAQRDLPLCAAQALRQLLYKVHEPGFVYSPTRTLVFLDPADPLIDAANLTQLIQSRRLDWQLQVLPKGKRPHMCIWPSHVGWNIVRARVKRFADSD
ncbi:MAG: alpha/beta fold hydrolase [Myxococcota bacterium]